jgi:hypothetical protein
VVEIQVFDGEGSDRFRAGQILAMISSEMRKTSTTERIRALLLQAVELDVAEFDEKDDLIVHYPCDQTVTFPSNIVGPPPGPWVLREDGLPKFDGRYWVFVVGMRPEFVADYSSKGWRYTSGGQEKSFNSQDLRMWKKLWRR